MIEEVVQKFVRSVFIPKVHRAEKKIGYRLAFHNVPERFINGWVSWDETSTWKEFGLNIEVGVNYWTIGKIEHGISSRYDPHAPEYQSWLGGYLVKLGAEEAWTAKEHFKLAVADQNSWLHSDGDPKPLTTTEGWEMISQGSIEIGKYKGALYEFGCTTHSDLGENHRAMKLRLEFFGVAALMNASNAKLHTKGSELMPSSSDNPYETIKLHGYIGIFDIEKNVKLVLYGNGAMIKTNGQETDTFAVIKNDLLAAMRSCEIAKA